MVVIYASRRRWTKKAEDVAVEKGQIRKKGNKIFMDSFFRARGAKKKVKWSVRKAKKSLLIKRKGKEVKEVK